MYSSAQVSQSLFDEIKEKMEHYYSIVNQSEDCIFLVDVESWNILEGNPSFQNLLGYSSEEITNLTLHDFITCDPSDVELQIQSIIKEKRSYLGELDYRTKDNRLVNVEVRASLINYNNKQVMSIIARDTTERKKFEKILRESEEKYRRFADITSDLIIIINQKFELEFVNEKAQEKILGYGKQDIVRKTALDFFHGDDIENTVRLLIVGFEYDSSPIEVRIKHKLGRYLWFELIGNNFTDQYGEKKSIFIARNITQRKKLEKLRDEFFEDVSYELRTPLIAIRGFAELLLKSNNLDTSQTKDLQKILDHEHRLVRLIDEILTYSFLKSGVVKLKHDKFRVSELITEIRNESNQYIESKSLKIELSFEPDDFLILDKTQITKVIKNLMGNAFKYSFAYGIISIKSAIKKGVWTFSIRDRGIGIPPEEISKLFVRYIKLENAKRLSVRGIGIGLAICRKIIDEYKGTISISSDGIDKGSIVTFKINLFNGN